MPDLRAINQKSPVTPRWYDGTFLVVALLIFLWPVGVVALYMNKRLGFVGKFLIFSTITLIWTVFLGASGFGAYWLFTHPKIMHRYASFLETKSMRLALASKDNEVKSGDSSGEQKINSLDTSPVQDPKEKEIETPKTPDSPKKEEEAPKDAKLPDAKQPDAKPPDAKQPDAKQLDVKQPDTKQPDAKQPDTKQPDAKQPDAPKPDAPKEDAKRAQDEANAKNKKEQNTPAEPAVADFKMIELDAKATRIKGQAGVLAKLKKQHVSEYEKAIMDYNTATNLAPLVQDIEAAFKSYLKDKYNTETFDEAIFNEYFTADYLRNYNTQLKRQQAAMAQYAKILQENDAKTSDSAAKLATEAEETNTKLTEAGKPKIELPPPDADVEKQLEELRAKAGKLPERTVTMAELREKIGGKVLQKKVLPPADEVALEPRPSKKLPDPRPPVDPASQFEPVKTKTPESTNPARLDPPVQPKQSDAPPVTPEGIPSITAADIQGVWVRGDGKVVWALDQGGIMSVRGKNRPDSRGSWVLDERTSTLSVTHGGVLAKFTVAKEKDQIFMTGGAGNSTALRFNKASKY